MGAITLAPGRLDGSVVAVPSKSDAHRALIAAALASGESHLSPWGTSDDVMITLRALQDMGLARAGEGYSLTGGGSMGKDPRVFCGQSGSSLRFLIPLSLVLGTGATFCGEGRLMQRPLTVYEELFTTRGIRWSLTGDTLLVQGKLTGGEFPVPGNISSQFITGLCFALPLAAGDSFLRFTTPLESFSYIRMTLDTLSRFGITIFPEEGGLRIPGGQSYRPTAYPIEGDWSYGAFWLVAGAIGGEIRVRGLRTPTLQGDSQVADILKRMGAQIVRSDDLVVVRPGDLRGTTVDLADVPDLAPVLAVAACAARGRTEFVHARRLRMKESDRLEAIAAMVRALGGRIETMEDTFTITGCGTLSGGCVDTWHDHRMAMAAAAASSIAVGPIHLNDRDCVAKSAPEFWDHFVSLGGTYHE